jgi:hypothetical protein
MVGTFYNIHVVLYDYYGVTPAYERVERFEQFAYVMKVQTGSGFVEDKYGRFGFFQTEEVCQFDALAFAARQG